MEIESTPLDGVYILRPDVHEDHRGFFMETFRAKTLSGAGLVSRFVQDNHSLSAQDGTLRGLHYQLAPYAQTKLVRVTSGAIFDVAVDIRPESSTFGKWYGIELSAENKLQLYISKGFAHGFCTLRENTEVLYKVDEYYVPEMDRGIIWNDPQIGVKWPTSSPILSSKDAALPSLKHAEIEMDQNLKERK